MNPLVSIITINYNSLEVTCELLDSIRKAGRGDAEIIVVDNASKDNPKQYLEKHYPECVFIRSEKNLGFAGGNNLGIQASRGNFLFFLNNDAELTQGAIESLLNLFSTNSGIGIASPKICYHNARPGSEPDVIQYVGATHVHPLTARNRTLGEGEIDNGQYQKATPTAYAHGAAMMVPREVIEKVGMMPEDFFLYYEELDWCEQIRRAGYEIWVEPDAKVYHKESYSVSKISALKTYYLNRNRLLFMRRNRSKAQWRMFCVFLFLMTVPKNSALFLIKGEWANLNAFLKAIRWNFTSQKIRPDSTPLTFSLKNRKSNFVHQVSEIRSVRTDFRFQIDEIWFQIWPRPNNQKIRPDSTPLTFFLRSKIEFRPSSILNLLCRAGIQISDRRNMVSDFVEPGPTTKRYDQTLPPLLFFLDRKSNFVHQIS